MNRINMPLPSKGVDIRTSDTSVRSGNVRSAINIDVTNGGEFSRRRGYSLAIPHNKLLAIHASDIGVFVHAEGAIMQLNETTMVLTTVIAFRGVDPASFWRHNDHLYVTNGADFIRINTKTGVASSVAVELPPKLPTLGQCPGSLTEGKYGVVMTVLDSTGEESAAAFLGTVSVTGGVRVSGLEPDGRTYRFYMTHTNGDIAYLALEMPILVNEVRLVSQPSGAQAPALGRAPLPPGSFVCSLAGRLYTAFRDTVRYSEPLRPHISALGPDFIRFTGTVTMLAPTVDGLYVSDDKGVWFLEGLDPTKAAQRLVSNEPAGFGSAQMVHSSALPEAEKYGDTVVPVWLTRQGYVIGRPGGTCESIISDRISVDSGVDGKTTAVQNGGVKQLITMTGAPWGGIASVNNSFQPAF